MSTQKYNSGCVATDEHVVPTFGSSVLMVAHNAEILPEATFDWATNGTHNNGRLIRSK